MKSQAAKEPQQDGIQKIQKKKFSVGHFWRLFYCVLAPLGHKSSTLFHNAISLMLVVGTMGGATPVHRKCAYAHVRGLQHNKQDQKKKEHFLIQIQAQKKKIKKKKKKK